jgi:hypothetical protein
MTSPLNLFQDRSLVDLHQGRLLMISADHSLHITYLATDWSSGIAQERLQVSRLLSSWVPKTTNLGATEAVEEDKQGILVESLHVSGNQAEEKPT